uniref:Uncharacterized protein n=1 Tax=Chromera velia CCMP2878 TaxID=1169474 RepID=A0A0G4IF83_9ALVE|eukprot:Cvel_13822.t1-p1 / transcript=Cvel_13822.t1 / gene=Cvel_13822 / organism=Chromera_velia_CCMP2878 / gene_product=hypothetical protein / transcript_product=hypothetical protein / location=Cvel_scaffold959:35903-38627(-) / protein_length=456 / sequence_SO=supercontig / SO=protein_coding / is_pseudo=false
MGNEAEYGKVGTDEEALMTQGEEEEENVDGEHVFEDGDLSNVYVAACFNPNTKGVPHPWPAFLTYLLVLAVQVIALMAVNPSLFNLSDNFHKASTPQVLAGLRLPVQSLARVNDLMGMEFLSFFLRTCAVLLLSLFTTTTVREDLVGLCFFVSAKRNGDGSNFDSKGSFWIALPFLIFSNTIFPVLLMVIATFTLYDEGMSLADVVVDSVALLFVLELDNNVSKAFTVLFDGYLDLSKVSVPLKAVRQRDFSQVLVTLVPCFLMFSMPSIVLTIFGGMPTGKRFIDFDEMPDGFNYQQHLPLALCLYALAMGVTGQGVTASITLLQTAVQHGDWLEKALSAGTLLMGSCAGLLTIVCVYTEQILPTIAMAMLGLVCALVWIVGATRYTMEEMSDRAFDVKTWSRIFMYLPPTLLFCGCLFLAYHMLVLQGDELQAKAWLKMPFETSLPQQQEELHA